MGKFKGLLLRFLLLANGVLSGHWRQLGDKNERLLIIKKHACGTSMSVSTTASTATPIKIACLNIKRNCGYSAYIAVGATPVGKPL
jgi:hypothetical protein